MKKLKIVTFEAENGIGSWIMISDCTHPEHQTLVDPKTGNRGPTFVECVECKFQAGKNLAELNDEGEFLHIYPERLACNENFTIH
jgi:hypothetical protein